MQSARKFSVWRKSRSRSGIISVSTSFFRSRVASFRPNDATFQSKNALRLSQRRRGHGQSLWRLVSLQSGKKGKKTTDRSIGVDHPTIVPVRFLIVSRTRSLRDDVRAELTHVTRNSFFIVVSIPVIRALRIVVVVYRSLIRRQIIIIVSEQSDRNPPIDRTGVVVHRVHRASPRVVVGKRVPSSRCVRPVDRRSQCQKSTPGSPWLRRSFRPSRVEKCRTRSKFEAFFVYTWRA